MFARPSERTVARWHRELRYFRFTRAVGGHARDFDSLDCVIPFEGEAGLLGLLAKLEYSLQVIPEGAPRIEMGQTYRPAEWESRSHPIRAYPRFAEPGATRLLGLPVYLNVGSARLLVDACGAAGKTWEITDEDFRNARQLEAEFDRRGIAPLSPGERNER